MKTAFYIFMMSVLVLAASPLRAGSMAVAQEFDVEYTYEGGGTTVQNDRRAGSVTEHDALVRYVWSPQLNKDTLLRVGAEWERFTFTAPSGVAVPSALQEADIVVGLDYQVADKWLVRGEAMPGFYGDFKSATWRNANMPLMLGGVYLANADLQWMFGVWINPRSELPIMPGFGVRWKLNNEWTLNLQAPRPRVEYNVNDNLQLYFGGEVKFVTCAVNNHFGTQCGLPQLNNATVDFTEARVGPGVSWKILPTLSLEVNGGYVLGRWWNFYEQNIRLESRPAPYGQIACRVRF